MAVTRITPKKSCSQCGVLIDKNLSLKGCYKTHGSNLEGKCSNCIRKEAESSWKHSDESLDKKYHYYFIAFGLFIAVILVFLYQENNFRTSNKNQPLIKTPIVCSHLGTFGFPTREWKERIGRYTCNSDYYEVDMLNPLPNNIAYYVSSKNKLDWELIKIVGNVNNPHSKENFIKKYNNTVETLLFKLLGNKRSEVIPIPIIDLIDANQISPTLIKMKDHNLVISAEKLQWGSIGNHGYEYHFAIEKKTVKKSSN